MRENYMGEILKKYDRKIKVISHESDIAILAEHYGDKQFTKAVEELSELTTELAKVNTFLMLGEQEKAGERMGMVISEMADVEIMIEQLKIIMNCQKEFAEEKEYKIKRQLRRIKKEEKKQE